LLRWRFDERNIQQEYNVTISLTMKKTITALALAAPLALVACGSDDGADETTSSAPSTVTSTRTSETTTTETSEEETTSSSAAPSETSAEPTEGDTEDPQAAPQINDPFAAGQLAYEEATPVEGGGPASEADRAEIEGLVGGIYQSQTFHQFLRYVPENACSAVIEANGGPAALDLGDIPDMPLSQLPGYAESNAHIQSIDDVRVEGDQASAVVTAVSNGQAETQTQRFLKEDGRWKFCN